MDIHDAIILAVEAHRGQKDKLGVDYIYHPLRVMQAMATDEARMAAVLHDVVEDTGLTLDFLAKEGYPPGVLSAVDAVTRRLGEVYLSEFIPRAKADPIGRLVKIADIQDNLARLQFLPSANERDGMATRYEKALLILSEVEE